MTATLTNAIAALATSTAASMVFKATLVLAAGLLATACASRARASIRHALLTSTLAVVLALPVGAALMPALAISVPLVLPSPQVSTAIEVAQPPAIASTPVVNGMQQIDRGAQVSLATVTASTWALGAVLLVGWLALAVWRLRRIRRTGLPWLEARPIVNDLAVRAGINGLLTCSFMKRSPPRSRAGSSDPRSSSRTRLASGATHPSVARSCTSWNTYADAIGGSILPPGGFARFTGSIRWCGSHTASSRSKPSVRVMTPSSNAKRGTRYAEQLVQLARADGRGRSAALARHGQPQRPVGPCDGPARRPTISRASRIRAGDVGGCRRCRGVVDAGPRSEWLL